MTLTAPDDKEPVTVQVAAGGHELTVTKGGFVTATKQFTVKSGEAGFVRVRPTCCHSSPRLDGHSADLNYRLSECYTV